MAVENRLKEILDERGIKQNWLAEQVGMAASTMSNLLKNKNQTNIDLAFKIADKLDMRIDEIFIYTRD